MFTSESAPLLPTHAEKAKPQTQPQTQTPSHLAIPDIDAVRVHFDDGTATYLVLLPSAWWFSPRVLLSTVAIGIFCAAVLTLDTVNRYAGSADVLAPHTVLLLAGVPAMAVLTLASVGAKRVFSVPPPSDILLPEKTELPADAHFVFTTRHIV